MERLVRAATAASFAALCFVPSLAAQGPPPEVQEVVGAVVEFLNADPDVDPLAFGRARLTEAYRASFTDEAALRQHLASIREAGAGATGDVSVEADDDGLRLILEGGITLALALEPGTARLTRLELLADTGGGADDLRGVAERRMRAVEELGRSDAGGRRAFVDEHLDPALADRRGAEALDSLLVDIGRAAGAASSISADVTASGYRLAFRGGGDADVIFTLAEAPPYAITDLRIEAPSDDEGGVEVPPLTWATLDERLRALEAGGFAGSVLAVRDGRTVLDRGLGEADRSTGRLNDSTTLFGIGSIPIDFTRAAVYLLVQEGRLALDETVADVFPDVPAGKREITIAQLLNGTSGLPNFHHTAADADPDLTWIDRAEAERRILALPLLFEPGASSAPSHSAFVLLAAAVERRSGQSYESLLRTRFFEPAGMTRTGFYGDDSGHPADAFASGYGADRVGTHNSPPEWGPTSWLIMGSGGMWSTPGDLARWFDTLRSGRILQGDALARYLQRGPALGASDRGFLFVHAWAGGDTSIYLAGNAGTESPEARGFVRRLLELVGARPVT